MPATWKRPSAWSRTTSSTRRLEQVGGPLAGGVEQLAGGVVHGGAGELHRPGPTGDRSPMGMMSVSPWTTSMRSMGMPSRSLTSMAHAVWWPWP